MPEVLLIERGTVMHVQYGLEYWKLGLDMLNYFELIGTIFDEKYEKNLHVFRDIISDEANLDHYTFHINSYL